jgi:hypothetical protein
MYPAYAPTQSQWFRSAGTCSQVRMAQCVYGASTWQVRTPFPARALLCLADCLLPLLRCLFVIEHLRCLYVIMACEPADLLGVPGGEGGMNSETDAASSTRSRAPPPLVAVSAVDRGLLLLGLPQVPGGCGGGALAVLEGDMHVPDVLRAALPQQPSPWMRPLLLGAMSCRRLKLSK